MSILDAFDPAESIFKPENTLSPVPGFPKTVISTFSQKMLTSLPALQGAEIVATMRCGFEIPVYCVKYKEREFAVYLSVPGAASTAALMEEAVVMGGRKFLFFGSCGSLDETGAGRILVPERAYRDEGTSYHYAPKSESIDVAGADALANALTEMQAPHTRVTTWTTDGVYRETPGKAKRMRERGCSCVEMECAALAALAKYRNVFFAQFLYTADSLAGKEWDRRILGGLPRSAREAYWAVAMEAAMRL